MGLLFRSAEARETMENVDKPRERVPVDGALSRTGSALQALVGLAHRYGRLANALRLRRAEL